MFTTARFAAIATLAVVGAMIVPTTALATSALLGPTLAPLPASASYGGSYGGSGSPTLNAAVSAACYSGAALGAPEWFTLPSGNLGTIYARAHGVENGFLGHGVVETTTSTRVAVVDYVTGVVLSCRGGPVTVTSAHPSAVVVWFSPAEIRSIANRCAQFEHVAGWNCTTPHATLFVNRTTGVVPVNNAMSGVIAVATLPFAYSGDSTSATRDGPAFDDPCGYRTGPDAGNHATVWWRYTATQTGYLAASVLASAFPTRLGVARVTPSGPVPVPQQKTTDGDLCPTGAFPITAGTTYLIASMSAPDFYCTPPLAAGGPYTLHLGKIGVPSPPVVFAMDHGRAGVTVRWTPPTLAPGVAAITSYLVSRDGTNLSGIGPRRAIVPAATTSYTLTNLVPDPSTSSRCGA